MQNLWRAVKVALIQHYTAPLAVAFRQFRNGAIYFGVGLATVLMANAYLLPSLHQELLVLAGLALTAIGFLIALLAEMRLLISRFVQFAQKR